MNAPARSIQIAARTSFILGVATLIAGVLAVAAPLLAGTAINAIVGVLLIAGGITRTLFCFKAESFGRGALAALLGGLAVVGGCLVLANPMLGLASITTLLVAYFVADGVVSVMGALQVRGQRGWGWMLFHGIVALALSWMIWSEWPLSGAWAVGTLVGINLIFSGFHMIMLGAAADAVADGVERAIDAAGETT